MFKTFLWKGAGKRWHEASGANICYVSFSGPTRLEDMLKQKLFEFVASKARALAKIVYEKHESSKKTDSKTSKFQLKAVGTGAGVQAAVFYSRHIEFYFNTKVAFLLGTNLHLATFLKSFFNFEIKLFWK